MPMKGTGMKNHPTSMIPITMTPIKMMPMEDPMLGCLPTTRPEKQNGRGTSSIPWLCHFLREMAVNKGHTLIPSKWVDVDKNSHKCHEAGLCAEGEESPRIVREL